MKRETEHHREDGSAFAHPEAREGESFFANASVGDFEAMPFSRKRLGEAAYDGEGRRLSSDDWRPVFVLQDELAALGRPLSELRAEDRARRGAARTT